jgi:hypothetical protein
MGFANWQQRQHLYRLNCPAGSRCCITIAAGGVTVDPITGRLFRSAVVSFSPLATLTAMVSWIPQARDGAVCTSYVNQGNHTSPAGGFFQWQRDPLRATCSAGEDAGERTFSRRAGPEPGTFAGAGRAVVVFRLLAVAAGAAQRQLTIHYMGAGLA